MRIYERMFIKKMKLINFISKKFSVLLFILLIYIVQGNTQDTLPQPVRTFNHNQDLITVMFSHDGSLIFIAGGFRISVWETDSGTFVKEFARFSDLYYPAWCMNLSPDESYILMGSTLGETYLWDFKSEEMLHIFEGHIKRTDVKLGIGTNILDVVFSSNGKYVLTSGADGQVILWDIETKEQLHSFPLLYGTSVLFSQDGNFVITELNIWDFTTKELIRNLDPSHNRIDKLVFSPDGKYLYSAEAITPVRKWDWQNGILVDSYNDQLDVIPSIALSPDGNIIVKSNSSGIITFFNTNSGKILASYQLEGSAMGIPVAFHPDGTKILIGNSDGIASLWSLDDLLGSSNIHEFEDYK